MATLLTWSVTMGKNRVLLTTVERHDGISLICRVDETRESLLPAGYAKSVFALLKRALNNFGCDLEDLSPPLTAADLAEWHSDIGPAEKTREARFAGLCF